MNRKTNAQRRPRASLREALLALQQWVENNVAYGIPPKIAAKVDAALAAAPSPTDRWHADEKMVRDENGLFVGAFNVDEDAALAAMAPGMHAALSEIAKAAHSGLSKRQLIDIAAKAITDGER